VNEELFCYVMEHMNSIKGIDERLTDTHCRVTRLATGYMERTVRGLALYG
jgi:hypothetical protein